MKHFFRVCLFCLIFLCACDSNFLSDGGGEATVTGQVVSQDNEPTANAKVEVVAVGSTLLRSTERIKTYTDAEGKYSVTFEVSSDGKVLVRANETSSVTVDVRPGKTSQAPTIIL